MLGLSLVQLVCDGGIGHRYYHGTILLLLRHLKLFVPFVRSFPPRASHDLKLLFLVYPVLYIQLHAPHCPFSSLSHSHFMLTLGDRRWSLSVLGCRAEGAWTCLFNAP